MASEDYCLSQEITPPGDAQGIKLSELHERHPGLTQSLAQSYVEAACVCLERDHVPPVAFSVNQAGNEHLRIVDFAIPDERTKNAHANEIDATETGAYGLSLAAIESVSGMVAVRRAETQTGADWYIAPEGEVFEDLESCIRLEVSGISAGSSSDVKRRLQEKVAQAIRGNSNLPAIAAVVGFRVLEVAISPLGVQGMTWIEFHTASETFAIEADEAFRGGDAAKARILYRAAAESEEKALAAVDSAKMRTRGITAVSAVALWYKAAVFDHAEQLAYTMLADSQLPGFARIELRSLVQAIWTEVSKQAANVSFLPGQVIVSVKGGEVITGGAPLDLIIEKVQTIQAMFYRTIEWIKDMPLRLRGVPDGDIQDSCRPWLFQEAPGSYQFSVAIQQPTQANFFRQDVRPDIVARQFLHILQAASNQDQEELESLIPKADYRNVFLKLSRNLAPTGKSFGSIEFHTPTGEGLITLTPEARTTINKTIKKNRSADASYTPGLDEELLGTLRAVDLDSDFLVVTVADKPVQVSSLGDAMDDLIGPMVNKRVKVQVVRTAANALRFRDIELEG